MHTWRWSLVRGTGASHVRDAGQRERVNPLFLNRPCCGGPLSLYHEARKVKPPRVFRATLIWTVPRDKLILARDSATVDLWGPARGHTTRPLCTFTVPVSKLRGEQTIFPIPRDRVRTDRRVN